MDEEVRRELDELLERVAELERAVAILQAVRGTPDFPPQPDVPSPHRRPGPPPGTYPTMS